MTVDYDVLAIVRASQKVDAKAIIIQIQANLEWNQPVQIGWVKSCNSVLHGHASGVLGDASTAPIRATPSRSKRGLSLVRQRRTFRANHSDSRGSVNGSVFWSGITVGQ